VAKRPEKLLLLVRGRVRQVELAERVGDQSTDFAGVRRSEASDSHLLLLLSGASLSRTYASGLACTNRIEIPGRLAIDAGRTETVGFELPEGNPMAVKTNQPGSGRKGRSNLARTLDKLVAVSPLHPIVDDDPSWLHETKPIRAELRFTSAVWLTRFETCSPRYPRPSLRDSPQADRAIVGP